MNTNPLHLFIPVRQKIFNRIF